MKGYKKTNEKELDDILSSALDDFDEEEVNEASTNVNTFVARAAASAAKVTKEAEEMAKEKRSNEMGDELTALLAEMNDPKFAETLEQTLSALSGEGDKSFANVLNPMGAKEGDPPTVIDGDIAKTLQGLSESKGLEGLDAAAAEAMGEEIMKKIMGDFEKLGEKEDFKQVLDGMMHQLLSKDVMYSPMSLICEKYPEWLADNEDRLSKDDYERYGKQYQYFQKIVALYETEPDNYERLMELFQTMQETGQPPAEIIKELAPGLEFGPDGLPMMNGMTGAMPNFTGMPGSEGLPENCIVM